MPSFIRQLFSGTYTLLFLCLIIVFSCKKENIQGSWTGYAIYENGKEMMDSEAQRCSLFLGDQNYFFRGNAGAIEKGLYRQKQSLLVMRDTLYEELSRNISYELKSADTLLLTMNKDNQAVQLYLKKNKSTN